MFLTFFFNYLLNNKKLNKIILKQIKKNLKIDKNYTLFNGVTSLEELKVTPSVFNVDENKF